MNFFAIPTLKNVRVCFRLPISMMPRFSLKLTLARLRTGIDSVWSRRRLHAGRRDADPLLAATHAQPVELRTVEELGEDRRNLLADDAGAVVADGHPEARRLAGGRRRGAVARRDLEPDDDIGQDARFLGRVERVVDGFLDAGEERLSRIVEAEQVAVLGEELRDRDRPLAGAHLDGGYGDLRRGGRGPGQDGG